MKNNDAHFMFLFNFLESERKELSREEQKQVMIEKVINLKLMCDYAVSCSYGDIVLIISMLRDYVRLLDERKGDDIQYQAYYRGRFLHIADHLSEQIGYDYDAALKKCQKMQEKEDKSDIGEDAMALAVKYSGRGKKKEAENDSGGTETAEGEEPEIQEADRSVHEP